MRKHHKLPRLFVSYPLAAGAVVDGQTEQSHHLLNVLRLKAGDEVLVFNGVDGEWLARLVLPRKKQTAFEVQNQTRPQLQVPELEYVFAPLKTARLDYVVQKAVEMGAGVLQPVMTQHTQNARLNLDRVIANAREAAQQCGALYVPTCRSLVTLEVLLGEWPQTRWLLFCDECAAEVDPVSVLAPLSGQPCAVLIGPEGGFSDAERALLLSKPYVRPLSLGPRILRADTAAVAAMALINAVVLQSPPEQL